MAKLHFRYGAMGSSKTALALMMAYNFREKGMKPLLVKPATDTRTSTMWSRTGMEEECISLESLCNMSYDEICGYDCIIMDEAQFATDKQVDFLAGIVDHLGLPVFAYGLKTDFQGHLFEGSKRLIELADDIEENKAACWCGATAKFSARVSADGNIIKDGDTVGIEAEDMTYVALCRKHYMSNRANS